MDEIRLKALAKINLGLDVTGRREDGYHNVRMIMQTIHLFDSITMTKTKKQGINVLTNMRFLPTNEHNLAYKAAKILMDEFELQNGVVINIKKCIPVAAGLAGGSSDAAAVLFGMNRLFSLHLSFKELAERGVGIGADVPYCLMRGTALAEGIGEKLTRLPAVVRCPVVIAKPEINVSTKWVYQKLVLDENTRHPDIDQLITDIRENSLEKMASHMGNILEDVTINQYPVISDIKNFLIENGALNAMMSGSGPTVFGLFQDKNTARNAADRLRNTGLARQIHVTTIFNV